MCDTTVTSNLTAAAFQALLTDGTGGDTFAVCINSGVIINSAGSTQINHTKLYVEIIGTDANPPTIRAIHQNSSSGYNRYINLVIHDGNTSMHSLMLSGNTSTDVIASIVEASNPANNAIHSGNTYPNYTNLYVEGSSVIANSIAINFNHSGFHEGTIDIYSSQVISFEASAISHNGVAPAAISVYDSTIESLSQVSPFDSAISAYRIDIGIFNSVLSSADGFTIDYSFTNTTYLDINDSVLENNGQYTGVLFLGDNKSVNINNATFIKGNLGNSADYGMIRSDGANNVIVGGATLGVCNVDTVAASFASLFITGSTTPSHDIVTSFPISTDCP